MLLKIKLNKIFLNAADKNGKAYVHKNNGVPYKLANIYYTLDGKEQNASGFADKDSPIEAWKKGDDVIVNIAPREYRGKTYFNFRIASDGEAKLFELEARIKELEDAVFVSDEEAVKPQGKKVVEEDEPLPDFDLPF